MGIDYQLLKGQSLKKDGDPFAQMEGFMYIAFAMLQPGQSYHAHSHDDHEEIYYITKKAKAK